MGETFLNGRIVLHPGDCLDVLARLEECSVDSCVTDPPYHLLSGGYNLRTMTRNGQGTLNIERANGRGPKGFMGQAWDGGDIAFRPETWRAVYRVLKPGAHLVACGGTRTFHRLACAIEDAGFEIRDTISWLYGSGFPKSHDVSKGIDRSDAVVARRERQLRFTAWMRSTGLSGAQIDGITNTNMGGHYTTDASQPAVATREHFEMLRPYFGCDVPTWVETLVDERTVESENFKRRKILVERTMMQGGGNSLELRMGEYREVNADITAPATDAARQWEGWGTSLKPAQELCCLARKPLSEGTVAANVLRWGTGAINVDGCRVGIVGDRRDPCGADGIVHRTTGNTYGEHKPSDGFDLTQGRWPANVAHDGSDEVVAAFPDREVNTPASRGISGDGWGMNAQSEISSYGDTGSAARFFYTAKANQDDRLGSSHPTVKPLDLMQWLVRLVTPRNGVCLDPFAGTGTTAEAAWREGCSAVLIEAEPEYQADIRRRMALVLAGPDERSRESIKAKNLPVDYGPLFGFPEAAE